ncbi:MULTISPECIES: DUF2285 domain-containing protein [Kordiimonas]|jgi:hypothetical protein|uniref:DUF2285 domain-containing protein n=1 Tax=Kordiimonas TaxID=288021 RepID=UPI00257B93B4|nr:DUF2285 domain-containing protein [Kordiimonas sp. UBA4487]
MMVEPGVRLHVRQVATDTEQRSSVSGHIRLADVADTVVRISDDEGHEYLQLISGSCYLELACERAGPVVGNCRIVPELQNFPDVGAELKALKTLTDMATGAGSEPPDLHCWTVSRLRHRDALAALDGRMAGLSYRQIALFLYGKETVARDWNSPDQSLKNRTIRAVRRGYRLMESCYLGAKRPALLPE